ncbi:MAG: hypothetical protein WC788_01030 [Candidatus Paceibacterota bacterium]|jgi:hypothetical protein
MTKIEKEQLVIANVTLKAGGAPIVLDLPDAMSETFGEIKLRLLEGHLGLWEREVGIMFPTSFEMSKEELVLEIEEKAKKRNILFERHSIGLLGLGSTKFREEGIGGNNLDWPTSLFIKTVHYNRERKVTWVDLYVLMDCYSENETIIERLMNRIRKTPQKSGKLLSLRDILERNKSAG